MLLKGNYNFHLYVRRPPNVVCARNIVDPPNPFGRAIPFPHKPEDRLEQ